MLAGDGAGLGEGGASVGEMGQPVDFQREAAGGLEESLDGGGLKQGQLAAGQVQAVGEVGFEFVAGEAVDMLLDDDALAREAWTAILRRRCSSVRPTSSRHRRCWESMRKLVTDGTRSISDLMLSPR